MFSSVAESVVAKLTAVDARFDDFMDVLTNVLLDWCDDRIQGAKAEFALYLDNSRTIVDRVALNDALKISAKHYFTNQLTARMREIILFEYADANILDATDGSLIRGFVNTPSRTVFPKKHSSQKAAPRSVRDSRVDSTLTTMRNALAIVFSSRARDEAMPEDAPSMMLLLYHTLRCARGIAYTDPIGSIAITKSHFHIDSTCGLKILSLKFHRNICLIRLAITFLT